MESYTLNYYLTFKKDYGQALQPVLNTSQLFIQEAIKAYGSLHSDKPATQIKFEKPPHQHGFVDYVIHEQSLKKQKAYEHFLEKFAHDPAIRYVSKLKPSLDKSFTSLFRVVDLNVEESIIYFDDLLHPDREIAIVDNVFANSLNLNDVNHQLISFFRFVPFLPDFLDLQNDNEEGIQTGKTTGFMYFFLPSDLDKLIKEYKRLLPQIKVNSKSAKRQIAFTELDKKYGQKLLLEATQ